MAIDVHTFCPLRTQPPSTHVARVERAARSLPAPGSLKSWHHTSSPRSVGPTQRSCCSAVPWAMMVGSAQAPTARWGRCTAAAASSSSMTSCSTGPAPGPTAPASAGVSSPASTRRRRRSAGSEAAAISATRARTRSRTASASSGRSRASRRRLPVQGGARRLDPQVAGGTDELAQRQGPPQVEVGVVLPGEAHAPQDLDAALGTLDVGVEERRPRPARPTARPGRGRRRRRPGPCPRPARWSAPPPPACRPGDA